MTEIADFLREQIVETAESMFGTRDLVILRVIDIAWSGWECDEKAALIELSDGRLEIVITSKFGSVGTPATVLRERLKEYRRLISDTLDLCSRPARAAASRVIRKPAPTSRHTRRWGSRLPTAHRTAFDASRRNLSPRSLEILKYVRSFHLEPGNEMPNGDHMTSPFDGRSPSDQILDAAGAVSDTLTVEILQFVEIRWATDGIAALVEASEGRVDIVIPDIGEGDDPLDIVVSALTEQYRRLARDTENLLLAYWSQHPGHRDAVAEMRKRAAGQPARVVRTPGVMNGDPIIEGTQVLAASVLLEILNGESDGDIRSTYPTLPAGVVSAVLKWADERLSIAKSREMDPRSDAALAGSRVETQYPYPPAEIPEDRKADEGLRDVGRVDQDELPALNVTGVTEGIATAPHESHVVDPPGAGEMPPFSLANYQLLRDPDETDEEYAARLAVFEENSPLRRDSGFYHRDPYDADPDQARVKFELSSRVAFTAEKRSLRSADIAKLAGISLDLALGAMTGRVEGVGVDDLIKVLAVLGQHVAITIYQSADDQGSIFVGDEGM